MYLLGYAWIFVIINVRFLFCFSSSSCINYLFFDGQDYNYEGFGFSIAGARGSIPSFPIRDPLPSSHWEELAQYGRFMVYLMSPCPKVL